MYPPNLTWIELKSYVERGEDPLILPIGSVESHGAHLPIDTDTLIASFVADTLAERNGWISLPPITYSIAVPVRPGNVWIPPHVFSEYLKHVLKHFASFGQKRFVVVLGHGGPEMKKAVREACTSLCRDLGISIAVFHVLRVLEELGIVDQSRDRHAGFWETSIVMAIDRSLVRDLSVYGGEEDLKAYGVAGNPFGASPGIGEKMLKAVVSHIESALLNLNTRCFFNWEQSSS